MNCAFDRGRGGRILLAAALAWAAAAPAPAWNHVGHKAVAGLAWKKLGGKTRERLRVLLERHPDFSLLSQGAPEQDRHRVAFLNAAYWPDTIKGDPRFYDEGRSNAVPTPALTGFFDMKQRRNWHYVNVAFSPDGTATRPAPEPNVLTQLKIILPAIGRQPVAPGTVPPEQDPVYLLPWLLHLVGDVHQPLHCATRYLASQVGRDNRPMSDLGGNTVRLAGGSNLHAFWDDALGDTAGLEFVELTVRQLESVKVRGNRKELRPEVWVQEGFAVARIAVYSFGDDAGTAENPITLPDAYVGAARKVAGERAALGALRLAELLNRTLR